MTASLDTNVIIRLFIDDDAEQTNAADGCLKKYSRLHLSDTAIIESLFVLGRHYGLPRELAVRNILSLLNHPKILANRQLFKRALPHYVSHPALSIEDCCLAMYAELAEATPLLTFDKKLARQLPYTQVLTIS